MFCKNCGQEINDKAAICIHCGCTTGNNSVEESLAGESKKGFGILMGIFLGLIGLVIGICLYPANSVERKTFIKGWGIAFAISLAVSFVLIILMVIGFSCLASSFYYY